MNCRLAHIIEILTITKICVGENFTVYADPVNIVNYRKCK